VRRALYCLAAAAVLLAAGAVATLARVQRRATVASGPRTVPLTCDSPALGGTLPTLVYLPAGYTRHNHYRVIYFLHGLPANPDTYKYNAFVAAAVSSGPHAAIVVAPQGARHPDSDDEYLDQGPKENWPVAIADDLPRCVDNHFSTIRNRTGRALVGLSAGGYGAANIGLRNVGIFGAVESWSGYFEATNPAGTRILDLGSPQANANAHVPRDASLASALATAPTFLGFYVGRQDGRFLQDNIAYDGALRSQHISHLFRIYQGGHSGVLWNNQAANWLSWALSALAAGR
jgi:enterochelin esterase-like enzyme